MWPGMPTNFSPARTQCSSATLDKNPDSWQAHNHLGAALYMEGHWQQAGPHFKRATELKPENPESHNNLGLYYSLLHDMDSAIHQYEIAVSIKDDSAMDTNLANAYESVGRYDDAIRTYKHAIELSETNASAHCNMGYALMRTGHIDEAIPQFIQTIELDPRMPQGRTDLFEALRMKGVDFNNPVVTGTVMQTALELLRRFPPDPPQQRQGAPQ